MDPVPLLALHFASLPFSGVDLSFLIGGAVLVGAMGLLLRMRIGRQEPPPNRSVPTVERVGVEPEHVEVEA